MPSDHPLHAVLSRARHNVHQFPVTGLASVVGPILDVLTELVDEVYSEHPHTGGDVESIGDILAHLTTLESTLGFEVPRHTTPSGAVWPVVLVHVEELDFDEAERLGFDATGRTTTGWPVKRLTFSDGRSFVGYQAGEANVDLFT